MTDPAELSLTAGAMRTRLSRRLPDGGLVEFEEAPAGWLCKDGTVRRRDWRRYHYTSVAIPDAPTVVLPSVTTICGAVIPKDGLPPWSEARGIEGAREACRRKLVDEYDSPDEWVDAVCRYGLGADAARDTAADRGLNVHAILETYMQTGSAPNPAEHPEAHRPFIQGLVKWLLWADPEPEAVELLVVDPDRKYAGRADLIARINGRLTLVDLKTNPNGQIFESAHLQVELLNQAERAYGEHDIEAELVVVVHEQGDFREMESVATPELAEHALDWYREVKALCAACEDTNKIMRGVLDEARA